jgi:hypothetical protein
MRIPRKKKKIFKKWFPKQSGLIVGAYELNPITQKIVGISAFIDTKHKDYTKWLLTKQ